MAATTKTLASVEPAEIESAIPGVKLLGAPDGGGQKAVYPCAIKGGKYALKLVCIKPDELHEVYGCLDDYIAETKGRVQLELDIMAKCQIPQLVQLGPLSLGEATIAGAPVLYYAEEWVDGMDLTQIVRSSGSLSKTEVIALGRDVCRALKEIGKHRMVHRDIKPRNIMRRNEDGSFVLLDLGFALDLEASSLSKHGHPVGTITWFAPEQFDFSKRKEKLGFRSDMFSLGAVMYYSLTGKHPFMKQGMNGDDVIEAICRVDPHPPSIAGGGSDPDILDNVIMKMLAKKPHRRFSSCDWLLNGLTQAETDLGG